MSKELPHFKVVMVGNSGVGKTSFVQRIVDKNFEDNQIPTVGAQYASIETIVNGKKLIIDLWDTAGQEVFRSLVGFYTREATGAFILFDITLKQSFTDVEKWIDFIHQNAKGAKIVIFANKMDLIDERDVSEEEIQKFINENNLDYIDGSAKTGQNIDDAFSKMAQLVCDGNPLFAAQLKTNTTKKEKSDGCKC